MVYNYTKPRGPIAAQYNSPGPSYALPSLVGYREHDPRSIHYRAPAFPFGVLHTHTTNSFGPGPSGYYPDPKICRTGSDGSPRYSLYSRQKDLTQSERSPGPGAYAVERGTSHTRERSPAYSMGGPHGSRTFDTTPAPNAYYPPSLLGKSFLSTKPQAPAYALYGRSKTGGFNEDLNKTPGPGTYLPVSPDQYKTRLPAYSLSSRHREHRESVSVPGPGAHHPEKVTAHIRQSPKFSFGIRHSEYVAPMVAVGSDI